MMGVYGIRNTFNGHLYVGSSIDVYRRCQQHRKSLEKGKHHCRPLQRAWNKYGADCFDFVLLSECSENDIQRSKQSYIDRLHPAYNVCKNAYSSRERRHSQETKRKLSVAHTGKILSDNHRANLSKALIGNKRLLGYKHSDEAKKKMSAKTKGELGGFYERLSLLHLR